MGGVDDASCFALRRASSTAETGSIVDEISDEGEAELSRVAQPTEMSSQRPEPCSLGGRETHALGVCVRQRRTRGRDSTREGVDVDGLKASLYVSYPVARRGDGQPRLSSDRPPARCHYWGWLRDTWSGGGEMGAGKVEAAIRLDKIIARHRVDYALHAL